MIKIHFSFLKSERIFFLLFSRLNANKLEPLASPECCYLSPPTRTFQVQVRRGRPAGGTPLADFRIFTDFNHDSNDSCSSVSDNISRPASQQIRKKNKQQKKKFHNYLSLFVHGIYLGLTRVLKPDM